MFKYDFDGLNNLLQNILRNNLSGEAWKWLDQEAHQIRLKSDISKFNIAFVSMPRKTGKNLLKLSAEEASSIADLRKDLQINGWTADRLARVCLLLQLDPSDKERYIARIENLFLNAEMSELVALYSALPLLAYPESWKKRCAEGIRNNIGQVLEAVICNNPYPSEQLDDLAWNQLVLKAIFTEKPVLQITGLRARRNTALAQSLSDYAHERWAAHRDVNPLLWLCVAPFMDAQIFPDIQRIFSSEKPLEREAAALACYESNYEPAKKLLDQNAGLKNDIAKGKVTWEGVASKMHTEQMPK
jgi:hypothetical protein